MWHDQKLEDNKEGNQMQQMTDNIKFKPVKDHTGRSMIRPKQVLSFSAIKLNS